MCTCNKSLISKSHVELNLDNNNFNKFLLIQLLMVSNASLGAPPRSWWWNSFCQYPWRLAILLGGCSKLNSQSSSCKMTAWFIIGSNFLAKYSCLLRVFCIRGQSSGLKSLGLHPHQSTTCLYWHLQPSFLFQLVTWRLLSI